MPLTPNQIEELKSQLKAQIKNLPQNKRAEAEAQIEKMSPEAIESMLKQQQQTQIFRLIAKKQIQSTIIQENAESIAVLEINPISKGHTIIIPKKPITNKNDFSQETKTLAKEVTEKLKANLKPKDIKIIPNNKFNEVIIDIILEYDKPLSLDSPRQQADKKELEQLEKTINTIIIKKEPLKIIKQENSKTPPLKALRRIP